ncbi:hypothetical protein PPTG_23532 [Phytophthora nicotianae INRA-310]|uniref:Uncharacterized protein n=1 Tax=Phytophthora nicotianae (strain INRA-310) TaxID=761204 RepID=W2PYG4_PHYN3|nr:hypothetical protein PPTG_23532 [Phytophthora nicotianae INRA-310]ETN05070.1 hypothetical protein PPTG_23532 [Phytophthora nicotianae INRA-310]
MPDSWEPRDVLLADVPDCVAAYEADLAPVTDRAEDAPSQAPPPLFTIRSRDTKLATVRTPIVVASSPASAISAPNAKCGVFSI